MTQDNSANITNVTGAADGGLGIIPLGGLGEVGMNCTVYEFDGQQIMVDCGINFPEQDDYGVDHIIPSFAYLHQSETRLSACVITHGHEDHIGAIPYLLREFNIPIYGTPLALALIARRLKEHGLYEHATLNEISAGDRLSLGCFDVEFIHVNHSIPQSTSLAIKTPVGMVVHTSDFKVDHAPRNEPPIDLARFAQLGDEGVLCLLSDSTNVGRDGYTRGEGAVALSLAKLIEDAPGRVVVTLFSSSLHRIQSLLDIAHQQGKHVLMLGRSLLRNLEVGRELGLIHLPSEGLLIEPNELEAFSHDKIIALTTGSQGEPRSALTRIAMGDHSQFYITPGDLVIYSSRVIPGNEAAINRVINHLYRKGADVRQSHQHEAHASGHACQQEQRLILNLTRPRFFVPLHGEYRMLAQHAAIADQLGAEKTFVMDNGEVLGVWEDDAQRLGRVASGRVLVDGKGTDDLPSPVLQDRRKLARTGIVVAWLLLDGSTGEVVSGPKLLTQGVLGISDGDELVEDACRAALQAISELKAESRSEAAEVAETMRRAVRRLFNKTIDSKPVVVPIVHEL